MGKMNLGKLLLGLAIAGICSTGCHHRAPRPTIVATVRHNVDKAKEKLSHKCADVDEIKLHNFSFYTCKADINKDLIEKMELVAAVKKYAQEQLGFKQTDNYREYKNNKDEKPVTHYRLYVTPRWDIPNEWGSSYHYILDNGRHEIRIRKPTILKSTVDDLLDEKAYYEARGHDVYWRSYTSFGGGCNLAPEFFEQEILQQIEDVFHEDFHVIIDEKKLNNKIEESMATVFGKVATIEFAKKHLGEDEYDRAKERLEWRVEYTKEMLGCMNKLRELYKKGLSLDEMLEEKKEIIEAAKYKINNASLWDEMPYVTHFLLAYKVYEKHPDLKELVKIFMNAPQKEEEAVEYLKSFL